MITDEQEKTLLGMNERRAKHIRLVIENNAPQSFHERQLRQMRLDGFREGVIAVLGIHLGQLIMEADCYYSEQGIDRPMCGGVFLDWEETKPD